MRDSEYKYWPVRTCQGFIALLTAIVLGLAALLIVPFALKDGTAETLQEIFVAAAAPFYADDRQSVSDEPVVVVLINERTIDAIQQAASDARRVAPDGSIECKAGGGLFLDICKMPAFDGWPIPYDAHEHVLSTLLLLEPAAIMVDMVFQNRREWDAEGLARFGKRIRQMQEDRMGPVGGDEAHSRPPIPIYMPLGRATAPVPGSGLDTLLKSQPEDPSRQYIRFVEIGWKDRGVRYPYEVRFNEDKERIGSGHSQFDDVADLPGQLQDATTASVEIYQDLCHGKRAANHERACGGAAEAGETPSEFLVRWRSGSAQGTTDFRYASPGCVRENEDWRRLIWRSLGILAHYFPSYGVESERVRAERCAPNLRINARSFFPPADINIGAIADAVKGAVVFYGVLLDSDPDKAFSPVHGIVPGVDLHATAYDNLVAYRGQPQAENEVLSLVLMVTVFGALAWLQVWVIRREEAVTESEKICLEAMAATPPDAKTLKTSLEKYRSSKAALLKAEKAALSWATAIILLLSVSAVLLFFYLKVTPLDLITSVAVAVGFGLGRRLSPQWEEPPVWFSSVLLSVSRGLAWAMLPVVAIFRPCVTPVFRFADLAASQRRHLIDYARWIITHYTAFPIVLTGVALMSYLLGCVGC